MVNMGRCVGVWVGQLCRKYCAAAAVVVVVVAAAVIVVVVKMGPNNMKVG